MARFGSSDNSGQPGEDPTRSTQYSGPGSQYPGPNPAPFGPPDDYQPGNAPTQYAEYADYAAAPPSAPNPAMPENMTFNPPPPTPFYRKTPVLVAWVLLIVAMVAVIIWGIIQLASRGSGDDSTSGSSSETSSSSSSATTTSSTSATTSETSTTPSSTESSTAPQSEPPNSAPPRPQAPQQAPTPNAPQTEPEHKHHLPPLPSTITIPPVPRVPELPTVITLPPHL